MSSLPAQTSRLRVVVTEPDGVSSDTLDQLRRLGSVTTGPFDCAGLVGAVRTTSILMVRLGHRIDAEVIAAAPDLRAVVTATTGLNHIDLDACRARRIEVISIRGERAFLATITSTAELALALLMCLVRRIVPAHADVLGGAWQRDRWRGLSLGGMTLGILGLGRLGCIMAGYGHAFGMQIIGTDTAPLTVPPFVEMTDLAGVLAGADCISLHATHDPGKPPILGAAEFVHIKRGALIVNTVRGELVDEAALIASLQSGQVGGYGTDVLANETTLTDVAAHPLIEYAKSHSNVVITPHIGGATLDGLQRAEAFVVAKTIRHFRAEAQPVR